MANEQIPDEVLFFIAEGHYSTDQLLRTLYNWPSEQTKSHFLKVNEHLQGGVVKPGQMVIITPPDANSCQQWEAMLQEAARQVDIQLAQTAKRDRENLARHYAMLNGITTYTAPMYGWANNYFVRRAKQVEQILQQIDRLYVITYNNHGHVRTDHFFAQRKALFVQLNQAINGMMSREMFGLVVPASQLKGQLGISSKATVHQWKMQNGADSIKGFSSNYQRLTRTANIFSRLGYVSIGLDIVGGVANIQKACAPEPEAESCSRAKFTETGKTGGSIIGGMAGGGLAAYGVCNLIFGLETAGTSLIWCGVAVGAAGGYAGSKAGGWSGEGLGEVVYEASAQ